MTEQPVPPRIGERVVSKRTGYTFRVSRLLSFTCDLVWDDGHGFGPLYREVSLRTFWHYYRREGDDAA